MNRNSIGFLLAFILVVNIFSWGTGGVALAASEPQAPTNLQTEAVSATEIRLSWWDRSDNEIGFKIERSTAPGEGYSWYYTVGANVNTFIDRGLAPGITYWYRVIAYNAYGDSPPSNVANTATGGLSTAWGAPSELLATVLTNTQVILTWRDNANNETGFQIERCVAGGNFAQVAVVPQNTTTYFDSELAANKTYYYRVRSYHTGGQSDFSNIAGVTLAVPLAPEKLEYTVLSPTSVRLTWEDNSDSESGFKIERKMEDGVYTQIGAVGPNVTTYTDYGLTPDTAYTYRVQSYNSLGGSSYCTAVDTVTVFINTPTNLLAETVSSSQIKLSWTDCSDNERGFMIERRGDGGSFKQIATVEGDKTTYADTGLANRTTYYYRVRAYNAAAYSAYSNQASTTTGDVPAAPGQLVATAISETQIKLTWKDNSSTETGFRVERRGAGGSYTQIATVGANKTTYTNTGLARNSTYCYRVRAYNAVGNSPYSNEATVSSGVPAAPTKLTATAVPDNKIMLTWTDNADNETGFKIERKGAGGGYTQIATVKANTTLYADTGRAAATTYSYRVRAYNGVGNSSYTNETKATTTAAIVQEKTTIVLNIDKTTYYVNNRRNEMDAAPIISGNRTLLPIRYVAEPLGAEVKWDEARRQVTITLGGRVIELWIDNSTARVDGKNKAIDPDNPQVKPIIIPPGRTMLPLRFVSENMGCRVDWNADSREVKIVKL